MDPAEPQGFIKGKVRKDRGRKDIICCPRPCSESLGELGLGVPGSLLVVLQGTVLCLALLINCWGKSLVKAGESRVGVVLMSSWWPSDIMYRLKNAHLWSIIIKSPELTLSLPGFLNFLGMSLPVAGVRSQRVFWHDPAYSTARRMFFPLHHRVLYWFFLYLVSKPHVQCKWVCFGFFITENLILSMEMLKLFQREPLKFKAMTTHTFIIKNSSWHCFVGALLYLHAVLSVCQLCPPPGNHKE